MIPHDSSNGADRGEGASRATLDDLFRRAGVRRPDGPALLDPPNRPDILEGFPRGLSFSEIDRAITAMATTLRDLGLPTDSQVAIQLPHTVESVIAFLGVLRAGMIAVPLPILWRQRDIVAALNTVHVKAIITCGHAGAMPLGEVAMQAAVDLFPIRFVCGFGDDLLDGIVPLDKVFYAPKGDAMALPRRANNPSAHIAAITFDVTHKGFVPVMQSHAALIAAGGSVARACALPDDGSILSTTPMTSLAGIALTLVPWLERAGTLSLHHGFDADCFDVQARTQDVVIVPGPMVEPLRIGRLVREPTAVVALWRDADRFAAAPVTQQKTLVDVAAFTEVSLDVARRSADGQPAPLPKPKASSAALTAIGGYRFLQAEVDLVVGTADPAATILAVPDAGLGQRFAGQAADPADLEAQLNASGVNPLIAGAFRPRAPLQRST